MAEPTGLAAVLEDAIGDRPLVPPETEQLDLLAMIGVHQMRAVERPRGRPPGAINRRTERVAEYLLSKYPDPLEGLMQMASLGIEEMCAALGCTRMEAFQELRLCRLAALPFVHRRMPQAIDLTNHNVVHLSIQTGASGAPGAGDGGVTILGGLVDIEENQEVSDGADGTV